MMKFFIVTIVLCSICLAETCPTQKAKELNTIAVTDYQVLDLQSAEEKVSKLVALGDKDCAINALKVASKKVNEIAKSAKKDKNVKRLIKSGEVLSSIYDSLFELSEDKKYLDKKAYRLAPLWTGVSTQRSFVMQTLEEDIEANGKDVFYAVPLYLMQVVYFQYAKDKSITDGDVTEAFLLTSGLNELVDFNGNEDKRADYAKKIENFFTVTGVELDITCDFIAERLVTKFKKNSKDIVTVKKIILYSQKADCTNEAYYEEAKTKLFELEPTEQLAHQFGKVELEKKNYSEALNLFESGLELSKDETAKRRNLRFIIKIKNHYLTKSPSSTKVYEIQKLIAQLEAAGASSSDVKLEKATLYVSSYKLCSQKKSRLQDAATLFKAYDLYLAAGAPKDAARIRKSLPRYETIFTEGYDVGDEFKYDKKSSCPLIAPKAKVKISTASDR